MQAKTELNYDIFTPTYYECCKLQAGNARETHHSQGKPLCTMINFGSLIQRNALDHESDDPFLDYSDQ